MNTTAIKNQEIKPNQGSDKGKEDWVECMLGEICFTTSGGTPSRANKSYYTGEIPWVKSGELDKGIIYDSEEHITEEAIKNSSAKLFPKGTLLFALYGATIGKMAVLGVEAATNQAICGIFKSEAIKTSYLFNYLLFKKNKLISQGIGGAQPNISQTILKQLEIPLPPLPIQRAIVKKIEELFSSLDSGIADLKKAQEQLVIYRQAVLKKAFEELSEETTLENVKKDSLIGLVRASGLQNTSSIGVPYIKMDKIDMIGNVNLDNLVYVEVTKEEEQRYRLISGDILLNTRNSYELVGKTGIIRGVKNS